MAKTRNLLKPLATLVAGLLVAALTAVLAFNTQWRGQFDLFMLLLAIAVAVMAIAWYLQRLHTLELERNASTTLERNREVMSAITDAVFRADYSGRLVYVNQAWAQIAGNMPRSILGSSILHFLHAEDQPLLDNYLRRVREGHSDTLRINLRLRREDGRYHWCRLTARPYSTVESGEVVIGTLNDIQQQQEQMRIQSARMSVLDGLLGDAGIQDLANRLVLEWEALQTGQRASIVLKNEIGGALQVLAAPNSAHELIIPREAAAPVDLSYTGLAGLYRDTPVFIDDISTDPRWAKMRTQANQCSVAACWVVPFTGADGAVLGWFIIHLDQTGNPNAGDLQLLDEFARLAALVVQKSRLADEREASEKRFAAIYEHAAVGVLLVSPSGEFISANPSYYERSGYSEEDLRELTPNGTLYREDRPMIETMLRELRYGTSSKFTVEARYVRRDGELAWINLMVTLVRDTEGAAQYYVMIVEDITDRKRHEQALKEAAAMFESSREGMMVLNEHFRIINHNPAFSIITGLAVGRAVGKRPLVRSRLLDPWALGRRVLRELRTEGYWQGEVIIDRPDEYNVPLWVNVTAVSDEGGRINRYMVMFSDLSGLRRSQEQLQYISHFDSLTGLANRNRAMLRLEQGLVQAIHDDANIAVLFIDLDRFKAINDSLGHSVGDEVLRQAAERLSTCCPQEATLARLGGDEFLVIAPGLSAAAVRHVGEQVCDVMRSPIVLADGREIYIGASVGFACYPDDGQVAADLVRHADAAMDTAKSSGRDQVCGYDRAMTEEASARFEMERGLRKALENAELELHYQPIIRVSNGRAIGVEALVRWRHPERGLIPPDRFIPLAEHSGLIVQVGHWVLNEACRQMAQWELEGVAPERVAVNLSPRQFVHLDVVELVRSALQKSGLSASKLELEITESALMTSAHQGEQTLHQLKGLGVGLVIDDFGTGYSSLAYLRRFPLDKLKIDKSFLAGVPERAEDNQLVTTILDLAANMRLNVVAEGVETDAQWRFLKERHCGACQGYLFSPALPAAELVAWLREQ
ncbi:bifunctional diguanylate cyclase/phosphodiesterase [Halopseudomonas salina]|uniref:PAS domain S-box-containing protein/diguanylate cyclase (GGDEF) domain-containing protein n=1 Tax=Halopseudomonas salina TaxID=1323744 RepID=A0ABQ1Q047_9GAMM|nr:EAL domain-containing protein [Halopseudomonas salina]GGD08519.1 hypothetical protein GCM10007418_29440 [Halopseudomonas salina]